MTLEQFRDIVVIVYGTAGVLLFAVLIVVGVALLFAVRGLTRAVRDLIRDPLIPTLNEVKATIQDVRGTAEFVSDTAVHPLIRVVSIGKGIKRGVSVASGLGRRRS